MTVPDDDLQQFFRRHFPIVRAKCSRMLGDSEAAADIAQETFLRLWRSPVAGEPPAVRARFMYVTATRLAIDHLRHRRFEVGWSESAALTPDGRGPGPEAATSARLALARLAATLPPESLEILIYTHHDRMTQEEVAAVMGITARQVRRLLAELERKLERRKELSPHD